MASALVRKLSGSSSSIPPPINVTEIPSALPALQTIANDYGNYLQYPELTQQKEDSLGNTVEQMLAQLDELNSLIETVKLNSHTTQSLLPSLAEQTKRLDRTFELIDGLVEFVGAVSKNMDQLEERLQEVEQQDALTIQKAKRIFSITSTLTGKKVTEEVSSTESTQQPATPPVAPAPIQVLDTTEYFKDLRSKMTAKK